MSKRQVDNSQSCIIWDQCCDGLIINATREKSRNDYHEYSKYVNVCSSNPCLGEMGIPLLVDDFPPPRLLPKFATGFVQQACCIAAALLSYKEAIVYCKNSRSRSPSVIATCFILFNKVDLKVCLSCLKFYVSKATSNHFSCIC